jgi:hypothetical protein
MESQPGRDWTQIRLIRFSRTSVALGDLSPNPGDFSLWANSMVWPRGRRPVQAVSPCPVQTITKGPTGVPADRSQKAQDIRPGVSCCLPAMLLAQSGKSPPHDRFGRARITKERKNRMSLKSTLKPDEPQILCRRPSRGSLHAGDSARTSPALPCCRRRTEVRNILRISLDEEPWHPYDSYATIEPASRRNPGVVGSSVRRGLS